MIEPVPGVVIDRDVRRVTLAGLPLVVGSLLYSPYREGGHYPAEEDYSPEMVPLMRELGVFDRERPVPEMPESIHLTALTGENGWWVELAIYPQGPTGPPALNASLPEAPISDDCTAEEALGLLLETCRRTDPPPSEVYGGPFGGLDPGTWLWEEDPCRG